MSLYRYPTRPDTLAQFLVATAAGAGVTGVVKLAWLLSGGELSWWVAGLLGFGLAYLGWLVRAVGDGGRLTR